VEGKRTGREKKKDTNKLTRSKLKRKQVQTSGPSKIQKKTSPSETPRGKAKKRERGKKVENRPSKYDLGVRRKKKGSRRNPQRPGLGMKEPKTPGEGQRGNGEEEATRFARKRVMKEEKRSDFVSNRIHDIMN